MAQRLIPPTLAAFGDLPDDALIDVRCVALLFGCSVNTVWRRCRSRSGTLPKPVHPSPHQARWRVGDLRKALAGLANPVAAAA